MNPYCANIKKIIIKGPNKCVIGSADFITHKYYDNYIIQMNYFEIYKNFAFFLRCKKGSMILFHFQNLTLCIPLLFAYL